MNQAQKAFVLRILLFGALALHVWNLHEWYYKRATYLMVHLTGPNFEIPPYLTKVESSDRRFVSDYEDEIYQLKYMRMLLSPRSKESLAPPEQITIEPIERDGSIIPINRPRLLRMKGDRPSTSEYDPVAFDARRAEPLPSEKLQTLVKLRSERQPALIEDLTRPLNANATVWGIFAPLALAVLWNYLRLGWKSSSHATTV